MNPTDTITHRLALAIEVLRHPSQHDADSLTCAAADLQSGLAAVAALETAAYTVIVALNYTAHWRPTMAGALQTELRDALAHGAPTPPADPDEPVAFACPKCGEDKADELVWTEEETVTCQTCGHEYRP